MKFSLLILFLLLFKGVKVYAQENYFINSNLEWFIDTTQNENTKSISKYFVYVIYVSKDDVDTNKLCFTYGFIAQSSSFKWISPDYYYVYENEFVLVRLQHGITTDVFLDEGIDLEKISSKYGYYDLSKTVKIVQKLFPSDLAILNNHSTYRALICGSSNSFSKTYFNNIDMVPRGKSIYKEFPENMTIEYIENNSK